MQIKSPAPTNCKRGAWRWSRGEGSGTTVAYQSIIEASFWRSSRKSRYSRTLMPRAAASASSASNEAARNSAELSAKRRGKREVRRLLHNVPLEAIKLAGVDVQAKLLGQVLERRNWFTAPAQLLDVNQKVCELGQNLRLDA